MHFLRFILCVLTLCFIALYRVQKVRFYNAVFTNRCSAFCKLL
ncbi:hypothetical protein HMPREF1580_00901 [Gardnerella vaginalis JCP8070]|uniref:Uncharacterized protein n=1 Tax=Gardnerella pickettii JCP8017A TaxID=1261062 RepID=T2PIG5_9BIFI|nr:hypothetical protein HMPREF1583_00661 [Gardnerella vaginalis JCP8151B]EPI49553.1 hypothetical protein HMPREF1577_01465 [Gardnerella pickettii JCP8017A]EPI59339.1 hypothetical protein HMPREF1580_00901 [Gardnerella vaginalis JCP8070]EPI61649.1 hypothetical protein HMPREF1578_00808 [Gardnerella pickettii JCP8017B]KXA15996.1 hypothetical protein HMPREF3204_00793 [Gardnerella pickettii]